MKDMKPFIIEIVFGIILIGVSFFCEERLLFDYGFFYGIWSYSSFCCSNYSHYLLEKSKATGSI